jgi:uncharacterized protein YjbI with pentapeptide repeats
MFGLSLARLNAVSIRRALWGICLGLMLVLIPAAPSYAAASTAAAGSLSEYESGDNSAGKSFVGKNLNEAQFANAKLDAADFSQASLVGAVFSTSTLKNTIFKQANLTQTIFDQVRFVGADLTDANLTDAMLLRATFKDVKVEGTDFTDALLAPQQVNNLCKVASGTNSKTGVDTRESLGCRG